MIEVYYYVPANEAEISVECGLKLSRWYDREVMIGGDHKKCISTLLNPKDDMEKYRSRELKCLKLELDTNYCYVADRHLYEMGRNSPEVMKMYESSVVPVNEYLFGSYRLPECLVATTIITGQISIAGRGLDSPQLFNNSEELYMNNIMEAYKEKYHDFNDTVLYYFYRSLENEGRMVRIEDRERNMAVFVDKTGNKAYTVKIPDLSKY